MNFKSGQQGRPRSINDGGSVVFERYNAAGVLTPYPPNQAECEAYGYVYNVQMGTCSAYRNNSQIIPTFDNLSSKIYGANNTLETATTNTIVMGENNRVRGQSRNNVIVGSNNVINNGVSNASAFGTGAEVSVNNGLVVGGNKGSDIIGKRQTIELMYGVKTTDGSNTNSNLNNTPDSYFQIPRNSACFFEVTAIAVRTGGINVVGAIGDFASWTEMGVARSLYDVATGLDVLSIGRQRKNYADSGSTTNWLATAILPTEGFTIRCKGELDCIIDWSVSVKLTQIKMEDETRCPEEECPEGWFWYEANCRCQQCEEIICDECYEYNFETCECTFIEGCVPTPCEETECYVGWHWDSEICNCVKDEVDPCFELPCGDGFRWNEELCKCEEIEE